MDTTPFIFVLGILTTLWLGALLIYGIQTYRNYYTTPEGRYQRAMRNIRIKQIAAVSCMFCLAMSASYGVIHNAWALVYLLLACKIGTLWFRCAILQRT